MLLSLYTSILAITSFPVDEVQGEPSMSQVIRTFLAGFRLGEVLGSDLCCIAARGTRRHLHFAIQNSTSTTYLVTHSPRSDVDVRG